MLMRILCSIPERMKGIFFLFQTFKRWKLLSWRKEEIQNMQYRGRFWFSMLIVVTHIINRSCSPLSIRGCLESFSFQHKKSIIIFFGINIFLELILSLEF